MNTRRRISRRVFLHGAGVTLTSLPLLEAMNCPACAAAQPAASPNDLHQCHARPAHAEPVSECAGRDYELTPYLEAVKEFRNDLTVFSGLCRIPRWTAGILRSCVTSPRPHPQSDNFKNTISLDQ